MKIKQSLSVNIKPMTIAFCIVSAVTAVIRMIQMLKFIDVETGFYNGGSIINILLIIVLAASSIYFAVASFLSKETKEFDFQGIKSTALGVVTAFFAFSLVCDWISSFLNSGRYLLDIPSLSSAKALMTSGTLPVGMQSFFALLSAIYFIILAIDFFKGTQKASKLKILAIMPVGWAGTRMIHRFIRQISYIEVSDLFLELVMIAFMIMFFMAFAQVNSGVYSDGFTWRLTGFGLPAAVIAFMLSVPRLMLTFVNASAYINSNHTFKLCDLAFVFFAFVLVVSLVNRDNNSSAAEAKEE